MVYFENSLISVANVSGSILISYSKEFLIFISLLTFFRIRFLSLLFVRPTVVRVILPSFHSVTLKQSGQISMNSTNTVKR